MSSWQLIAVFAFEMNKSSESSIPCVTYTIIGYSVQFSSVVSDSLRPHEPQHARPPCPSPSAGVHSDSHPSSQWCHPAISSSVVPFSSYPQSLPASESFPMSQLLAWGGQSTGVTASASFPPKNTQGWFPYYSPSKRSVTLVVKLSWLHWLSYDTWYVMTWMSQWNYIDWVKTSSLGIRKPEF